MKGRGKLGEALYHARLRCGLSVESATKKGDISASYITSLERGEKTNPTLDALATLADIYGIDVSIVISPQGLEGVSTSPREDAWDE